MAKKYDFSGWATKSNVLCSDGRTIMPNAFSDNDGQEVPLVWNHQHNDPANVLGHALLENRNEGVYAYCSFNDTESGKMAKELVKHGDVSALSIFANKLKQNGSSVLHGAIREVSLVLAGANPEAFIDTVVAHSEDGEEAAIIFAGYEDDGLEVIEHSDDDIVEHSDDKDKEAEMADTEKKTPEAETDETIEDVFNTLSEKQKTAVYAIVGAALENNEESDDSEDEGEEEMKHNLFDNDQVQDRNVLSHADQQAIIETMKQPGMTLKTAIKFFAEENEIAHSAVNGFVDDADNLGTMFPEYKELRGNSRYGEIIEDDNAWFDILMNKTQKVPYSRIRTSNIDLTDLTNKKDMMAKGYIKGNLKKLTGQITVARRTTDPQTVYVKSALHRDDVIDITDFDYVKFQYDIDQKALKETLAIATLFGDGRADDDVDKISPEHIRPIWTDDETFVIRKDLDLAAMKSILQGTETGAHFGDNYILAESMVETLTKTMDDFRGTGTPIMFINPKYLNQMVLSRDLNGRRMYSNASELKTLFGVSEITKVRQMKDKIRVDENGKKHECVAIIVNPADYAYGETKDGDITHFTDFDMDFNQYKSLLETRKSGALTRIKSAIVIENPAVSEG